VEGAVADFENKAFDELPAIEKTAQDMLKADPSEQGHKKVQDFITRYTNDFARAAIDKWNELGDTLWGMFARGF
jgi:hypothetical protein